MRALDGFRIVSLAVNLPGPVAAARLRGYGASVIKVEPPQGDPTEAVSPAWYRQLTEGLEVVRLDLKAAAGRARLEELLSAADLLITSSRPAALERLGLDWAAVHSRHPGLCLVAIVGFAAPREDEPGHDLTYQAASGLLQPPDLPRTLLADLAGAEQAIQAALALLLGRERGGEAGYAQVALAEAMEVFSAPLRHGLTAPGGVLGGALPGYNLYETGQGWIAVAALETHFWQSLLQELGLPSAGRAELAREFLTRTATEWEEWAQRRGLPIVAVRLPVADATTHKEGVGGGR